MYAVEENAIRMHMLHTLPLVLQCLSFVVLLTMLL